MKIAGIYRGLSDSLHAAIDTGNTEEVERVLSDSLDSVSRGLITEEQYADIFDDVRKYYDSL